tara:strand:+ start:1800 stop:2057 length:258 start_codon:yes stop_codon:yes gene_type:complete
MENSTVININGLLWEVKYLVTTHPTERNLNGDPLIVKNFDYRNKKVPSSEKCQAKRSNGIQCTRRKKQDSCYCGTHIKGTPHGTV